MVKQTAGRDSLGDFAPKFAELNDDVLFGEVWSREDKLSLKMRSILTVTALVSKGPIDSSFQYHAMTAKKNGVTKTEMAEIFTHLAFYVGWPNAWSGISRCKKKCMPMILLLKITEECSVLVRQIRHMRSILSETVI